jgi:hypothetical protein
MTKQSMRLEIKTISTEGTFEGLLSPYGTIDATGDVVEAGAFTKTLQEHGNTVPLLWQHDETQPIGELTLEDRPDGLYCKGQLLMDIAEAKKAYLLIKARIIKGLSIGFNSIKDTMVSGIRHLKEVRLWEGSIVTFPAASQAQIMSVKGGKARETKGDFNEELTEIQLQDAGYQMRCALSSALYSVVWADLTRDEKITAAQTIIDQFSTAYMAYLPSYLDMLTTIYGMDTYGKKDIEKKASAGMLRETLSQAREHVKNLSDILSALSPGEAGIPTPPAKAAGENKSEPDYHSAAKQLEAFIQTQFGTA